MSDGSYTSLTKHINPDDLVPKSSGQIIYVPHNCDLPDSKQHTVGTVFMCSAYYNFEGHTSGCYDLWELQAVKNAVIWVRVRPRWHNR